MRRESVRRGVSVAFAICCGLALSPSSALAQNHALPPRITGAARTALERLIDSARVAGLPTEPLVDKAAEGVLKGATDDRIIRAVQSLAREYGEARSAVGDRASAVVLGAAASALHVGMSRADLHRLAASAAPAGDGDAASALASALVTLVDLVAKRIPIDLASSTMQSMLERRATSEQFAALRSDVERDVLAGRAPDAALTLRARAQLRLLEPPPTDLSSLHRPPQP